MKIPCRHFILDCAWVGVSPVYRVNYVELWTGRTRSLCPPPWRSSLIHFLQRAWGDWQNALRPPVDIYYAYKGWITQLEEKSKVQAFVHKKRWKRRRETNCDSLKGHFLKHPINKGKPAEGETSRSSHRRRVLNWSNSKARIHVCKPQICWISLCVSPFVGVLFSLLYRDDTATLGSLCLGTKNTRGRVRKRSYFAADVTRSPEKYRAVSHFTLRSRT